VHLAQLQHPSLTAPNPTLVMMMHETEVLTMVQCISS
jgi:hypothetical protein